MLYTSDILVGGTASVRSLSCQSDDDVTLVLRDTDSSDVVKRRLSDVKNCLGIGYHEGHCILVRHNLKSALLMRHVDKLFYGWESIEPYMGCSDRIKLSLWSPCQKECVCGQRRLLLDMSDEVMNCSGDVLIRETRFVKTQQFYTLYAFLGSVCRDSGVNAMRYGLIKMFSPRYEGVVTVKLKDTAEATRFFTKMYMDVMR